MELVKRLSSNEIELGMKIPTIEPRASNILMTKGITYVVIMVRPIKIFVEYVGNNTRIQVLFLVIDQRARCLGHVYIVLEPIGSARLTFDGDFVLYELCDLVTE